MPIWRRRSGSPVPIPMTMRPGAISSSAEPVMARTTGWRVYGLTAPSAIRKPSGVSSAPSSEAIALTKVTASRSK